MFHQFQSFQCPFSKYQLLPLYFLCYSDRQQLIEHKLKSNGSILISDISKKLSSSEETIRQDLKEMEHKSSLIRIHGGAYLPEDFDKNVPFQLRKTFFQEEKQQMAVSFQCSILSNSILKLGFEDNLIIPSFAIMNSEYTLGLPAYQTSCKIADILSHLLERYFSDTPHVDTTAYLLEGAV